MERGPAGRSGEPSRRCRRCRRVRCRAAAAEPALPSSPACFAGRRDNRECARGSRATGREKGNPWPAPQGTRDRRPGPTRRQSRARRGSGRPCGKRRTRAESAKGAELPQARDRRRKRARNPCREMGRPARRAPGVLWLRRQRRRRRRRRSRTWRRGRRRRTWAARGACRSRSAPPAPPRPRPRPRPTVRRGARPAPQGPAASSAHVAALSARTRAPRRPAASRRGRVQWALRRARLIAARQQRRRSPAQPQAPRCRRAGRPGAVTVIGAYAPPRREAQPTVQDNGKIRPRGCPERPTVAKPNAARPLPARPLTRRPASASPRPGPVVPPTACARASPPAAART